jgi:hypothetical protein
MKASQNARSASPRDESATAVMPTLATELRRYQRSSLSSLSNVLPRGHRVFEYTHIYTTPRLAQAWGMGSIRVTPEAPAVDSSRAESVVFALYDSC